MNEDGQKSLYDAQYEHDSCGVGFVADINGVASHAIVERAINVLQNLVHRGAYGEDGMTGDGAGLLVQIPPDFFSDVCSADGIELPAKGFYCIGMFFLPNELLLRKKVIQIIEHEFAKRNGMIIGWRNVPVDANAIGPIARLHMPYIAQCFVKIDGLIGNRLEIEIYKIRRAIEQQIRKEKNLKNSTYIASLSSKIVVYKGMMLGNQISNFYLDLKHHSFTSTFAVLHQRYSTNTFPSWQLAQPFRYLAHNGEINTLKGNRCQMRARENQLFSEIFGDSIKDFIPILDDNDSDSACLDKTMELLVLAGRDISTVALMLIPQAWGNKYPLGPDTRGLFEYHSGLMEPWDGPAAVVFTDGQKVGAILDRNGLRPLRYTLTKHSVIVMASETGVIDIKADEIVEEGRLAPGHILVVDTIERCVKKDEEIKAFAARKLPYRRWVYENRVDLHGLFNDIAPVRISSEDLQFKQGLFGYTREDVHLILNHMASQGIEPIGAMGSDTPLAVLSEKPQLLYSYFKQLFAQVTNPPIDSIREEIVMSLMTYIGNPPNILEDKPDNTVLIKLPHPILSNEDIERLTLIQTKKFRASVLKIAFSVDSGVDGMNVAIEKLCNDAARLVIQEGTTIIILSDRNLPKRFVPIPALLAVSAVNQRLIREGLRTSVGILLETGEPREIHHIALLLGYGATAINPYLAFETIAYLANNCLLQKKLDITTALENYVHALNKGLLKVMSKMGISTLRSYRGAQIFEALGLNDEVVERFFSGTPSRIGGIGIKEIAEETLMRYKIAIESEDGKYAILPSGGQYRFHRDGERHLWQPEAIVKLQLATRRNDKQLYREYAELINNQTEQQYTLRGLLRFKHSTPIPIEEVEPVENIIKRFVVSAMSFGSISREAHETLAIAMNRIGAMSNSGEGGEDPARYIPLPNGDNKCSAVKQIASGRFGVTLDYIINARELQIKIAQGAKPGEGGQLPGHKVNEEIARIRHSLPGITLISPPPHHDIYSIEDLKQLIFDLKNVNPQARISVKLVSGAGVGTIAAGVVKAKADMILISGYDGGTGAAPLSSIKHAGVPWELGISETHQTLILNNLRRFVRLQCDGQMKTGRDVVIAALLGAEEFGFGSAALVVSGCVMLRKCHENVCPMGIATQNPELRKRYRGKPEYIINYFRFVAEEVREIMAELGFRTFDEMIGRADMLEKNPNIGFWKAQRLDFSRILSMPSAKPDEVRCTATQNHELENVLDKQIIEQAKPALENETKIELKFKIRNTNRAVGAMLSGEITKRYGAKGLPDDTIRCIFHGTAGQSFGAFLAHGVTLHLEGSANDYLGKGLCGGKIIVKPPKDRNIIKSDVICGNVILYGATAGEVYIAGCAGERFAIRNSGAQAVVEGVGDHGCEYMTGGIVVVLGETGVNFAAGMTGGIAFVFDPHNTFDSRCNLDTVDLESLVTQDDVTELKKLIERHVDFTDSKVGRFILETWEQSVRTFVKVLPVEYRYILGKMSREDAAVERQVPAS